MTSLWTYFNSSLSRHVLSSGFRSAVVVPDSMVLCVEGDRPGLCGPSPSPTLRRLLCKGQNIGQVSFPSTVTRLAWASPFRAGVSGIATDVMLFRLCDVAPIVCRTRVASGFVHGELSAFTHQASVEARSAAKRGRDSSAESTPPPLLHAPTPPTPLGPALSTPDHA